MQTWVRRGRRARQRTVPYLGIACLALLALTGIYAMPEMGALGEAPTLGLPAVTWLAERAARPGSVRRLATRLTGQRGARWLPAAAPVHVPASASVAPQPAPRARGALALPALLIAIALAQTH